MHPSQLRYIWLLLWRRWCNRLHQCEVWQTGPLMETKNIKPIENRATEMDNITLNGTVSILDYSTSAVSFNPPNKAKSTYNQYSRNDVHEKPGDDRTPRFTHCFSGQGVQAQGSRRYRHKNAKCDGRVERHQGAQHGKHRFTGHNYSYSKF